MDNTNWYLHNGINEMGPFTTEEINSLIDNKQIEIRSTLIWKNGYEDWLPLKDNPVFVDSKTNHDSIININSASFNSLVHTLDLDEELINRILVERENDYFSDVYNLADRIGLKPHELNNIRKLTNITF